MTGQGKAVEGFRPTGLATLHHKPGQGKQLANIGFGFRRGHCSAGARTDSDKIVVAAGNSTGFKIEAESELGEQQQLLSDQRRAPSAGRRRSLDRGQ